MAVFVNCPLFKVKLFPCRVARAEQQTNADDEDKPDPVGTIPSTTTWRETTFLGLNSSNTPYKIKNNESNTLYPHLK